MSAPHDDLAAFQLRAVREGDEYTKAVLDGFTRAKAPGPGLLVIQVDREIFIPLDQVLEAVEVLVPARVPPRRAPP